MKGLSTRDYVINSRLDFTEETKSKEKTWVCCYEKLIHTEKLFQYRVQVEAGSSGPQV